MLPVHLASFLVSPLIPSVSQQVFPHRLQLVCVDSHAPQGWAYSALMDSQPGRVGKLRLQPMGMAVSGEEILIPVLWGDNSMTH